VNDLRHSTPTGINARLIFIAVACLLLGGALWWRFAEPRRLEEPSAAKSYKPVSNSGTATTSSVARLENVFFLPEADQSYASQPRVSSRKQPVVNGTRRLGPPRAVTSKAEGEFIAPRWSPDGLELLFSRPGYAGLFVKGADGGKLIQVTDKEGVGFKTKWNPDGSITALSNTGEKQTFLPDGTPVEGPSPYDDDSYVGAFTKDDKVYYRAAPGEPARVVSEGDDRFYGGVVSPDGRYIVYNGLYSGLYIKPLDGSGPTVYLGEGYSPSWLPDSSGIVYNISVDDGHQILASDLYLATVDGTNISNLTQTPDTIELNPSVSPDGSAVAYESDGVIYVAPLY